MKQKVKVGLFGVGLETYWRSCVYRPMVKSCSIPSLHHRYETRCRCYLEIGFAVENTFGSNLLIEFSKNKIE